MGQVIRTARMPGPAMYQKSLEAMSQTFNKLRNSMLRTSDDITFCALNIGKGTACNAATSDMLHACAQEIQKYAPILENMQQAVDAAAAGNEGIMAVSEAVAHV